MNIEDSMVNVHCDLTHLIAMHVFGVVLELNAAASCHHSYTDSPST